MVVYILNPDYEVVGMIDEAESILWRKKYNDIGEAEIYLPCDSAYIELLQRGYMLYRYDDDMLCKIETREIETDIEDGDYLLVTAKDICNLLSGRIIRWQIVYSGTVAGFIEKVLRDNVISPAQSQRAIANFTIDTTNFAELTETISVTAVTDDLLLLIISTCKQANYGFRVSLDINTHQLTFRLFKGQNKATMQSDEYVEFSPDFANILSSKYKEDDSNYKNIAYVGYETVDEAFEILHLQTER